jgi:dUTP pyrophosphatase
VRIPVLNVTREEVVVHRGDRIAQGIIMPSPRVDWQEVAELRQENRGGFGATGR